MAVHQVTVTVEAKGKGMHDITALIAREVTRNKIARGLATVFCQHTSCSLVVMENADPSARHDLERWLDRLVLEGDRAFTHTLEGADDMPSHIKMALTRTTETIPFADGQLLLGTWQGIYLWEHRRAPHTRHLVVTIYGE